MNKVFVVNHTHWDREWYRTKSDYQIILKRGIEYLIDQFDCGNIEKFFLDGQTIVVEDLKEVLSDEIYFKFISLIKSGVLEIGPWYVLPDEGLIDEVGFKMNLNLGIDICKKMGIKHSGVLYMPDTFGHSSGMPKIANDLSLEYAIIHRGIKSDVVDVSWEFEGSCVKTVCLATREGYYQTAFHSEDYIEKFDKYCQEFLIGNKDNDILFLNGCDHTFIPIDFKAKLEDLKKVYEDKYEIIEVTLSEFFKLNNYKYKTCISGELRNNARAFLLPGVLSTRQYLKRDNRFCIDYLNSFYLKLVEYYDLKQEDNNIEYLKKSIVKNHPHDSICGCSIDAVHRHMQVRTKNVLDNVNQSINIILNDKYKKKIGMDTARSWYANNKLVVLNHLNKGNHLINIDVNVPLSELKNGEYNIYLSNNEKKYRLEFISNIEKEILEHSFNVEPCYTLVNCISVCGLVDLNSVVNEFDVEFVSVNKRDNNISIDNSIVNLCNYHYISDRGDSYNFDPIGEYQKIENKEVKVFHYDNMTVYNILSSSDILKELDKKREKRVKPEIPFNIQTTIYINNNNSEMKFDVKIDNKHSDIKVVNIYNNINSVYSDTACDLLKRGQIKNITYNAISDNSEVLYNQHPSLTAILVNNCFQISHLGLNEIEVLDNKLLHTLFRATSDLSRRDLKSRRGGAGPSYAAIENQCLRELKFEFMISNTNKFIKNEHLKLYPFIVHQYE